MRLLRWRLARRLEENALTELLRAPMPRRSLPFADTEFLCLDIETTGLDPRTAEMLSVGWVVIRQARVELGTATSLLVRPDGNVGHSATVHGLTDTQCESGLEIHDVLARTFQALHGRALVVHYSGLDKALLDRFSLALFGGPVPVPLVDTLALERQRRERRHHVNEQQSLRLADLRRAYHLPVYGQHNCLTDAIATAELLLAMVATHGDVNRTRLGDLVV
ncbi:MAG: exonuclease domain-containing protein [Gammaproteobacteria bacterium]|nr:exonuclease domain-containing protein [Gammaproteobacteria bacterium]